METIASEADLQIAASSDAAAERGPEPEGRTPVGVWLQPALIALVLASAFIACYIGLQRDATPHHLPVAVLGSQLSEQVQNTLGDAVTTQPSGSAAAAHTALEDRDVVAVLAQEAPGRLVLHVAGANGLSTTTAVENLLTAYAHRAGQGLSITDDVPLVAYDSRGLAGFYLAFGVTLAGFVLAQNTLALSARMRLRHRLTLIVACSAAVGLVGAILAGPMLGAVPAPFAPLALTLALLAAAAAFATKLLGSFFGAVGVPMATLLLLTVGNSTSGATIGEDLLPAAAQAVSAALPPGAAVRAITDLSYFSGAHVAPALLTLGLWVLLCAALVWAREAFRRSKRHPGRLLLGAKSSSSNPNGSNP